MSDIIDTAQETEAQYRMLALAAAQSALSGAGPLWIDGKPHCVDCEEVIPEPRIKALPNTSYCISCAEEQEKYS